MALRKILFTSLAGLAAFVAAVPFALQPAAVGPPEAPEPNEHEDAVIQVYGADVWGWRGRFAIHTWIAIKPRGARDYTIYQVIGWRLRRGLSVLSIGAGQPARPWFGSEPILLLDRRGEEAFALIARVDAAARRYPYADEYTMWPGPNSNSFTAWVALEVPELGLELPFKALGKGWMESRHRAGR